MSDAGFAWSGVAWALGVVAVLAAALHFATRLNLAGAGRRGTLLRGALIESMTFMHGICSEKTSFAECSGRSAALREETWVTARFQWTLFSARVN